MIISKMELERYVDLPLYSIGQPIGNEMFQIHYFYESYILKRLKTYGTHIQNSKNIRQAS